MRWFQYTATPEGDCPKAGIIQALNSEDATAKLGAIYPGAKLAVAAYEMPETEG